MNPSHLSQRGRSNPSFHVEPLERRQMLAAAVRAIIPSIYTGPTTQTPLSPAITHLQFASGATRGEYYSFATDDAADDQTTSFFIAPSTGTTDAAIALFDADGNRLKLADGDATPLNPGVERLDATLAPKTQYILGVFSLATMSSVDIALSLPQQEMNSTLRLDAATGVASLDADSGENTFNSPTDPDYFPLDFFNGRADGVVTVSPLGLDVQSRIAVMQEFAQSGLLASIVPGATWWRSIGGASGETPTVNVTPTMGQNLAEGKYTLSAVPLDFTSPARAYHIDVSAGTLVAASIAEQPTFALGMPLPSALGVASITRSDILPGGKFYTFTAASTGPATIGLTSATVGTTLGLYDATGETLLTAHGRTTATPFEFTHDLVAGTTYRIGMRAAVGDAGVATLFVRQAYAPEARSLESTPLVMPNITLGGTSGARFFRFSLPVGIDALSLRLAPQNGTAGGATTMKIVGGNVSALTRVAMPGNVLSIVIDARTFGREIDVGFTAESSASFDFSAASIDVPATLPSNTPLAALDVATGDVSLTAPLGSVGQSEGVQFWAINTGTASMMTVNSTDGATPILAHYEEIDGALRLIDFLAPNTAGLAQRTTLINPARLAALVAVNARPDGGGGSVQIAVNGDRPNGVGVAMAPEPVPQLQPTDPPANAPFSANLRIRNVKLRNLKQRDLWETIVPFNVLEAPKLSIGPVTAGGAMSLRVQVLNESNVLLATVTSAPGQQVVNQVLSSLTPASIAGQKLRFLVESAGNNLGDGLYNLNVTIGSADPRPFQVLENSIARDYQQNTPSLPIFETIRTINVNSFLEGNFTSSTPYNSTVQGTPGSIDVYKFTHGPTPFSVYTEQIDTTVNTNIKLFRGRADALDVIPGTSFNLDYFPADRSLIDARIDMWNTDLARTTFDPPEYEDNTWYVVVKNEEGSRGRYRLRVSDVAPQQAGPGSTAPYFGYGALELVLDPRTGIGTTAVGSGNVWRLNTPSTLQGNMLVTVTPASNANRTYRLEVLDESGNVQQTLPNLSGPGAVTFSVPGLSASARYFLRPSVFSGPATSLNLSGDAFLQTELPGLQPGGHSALTVTGPSQGPYQMAEPYERANQFADGTFSVTTGFVEDGLMAKTVFWVDQPGLAQFTLARNSLVNNKVLALWRGTAPSGEFGRFDGVLRDFTRTELPDGSMILAAQVQPGMYYLTVDGTTLAFFQQLTITGQLPLPHSTLIELDPNSGKTVVANLNRVDPVLPHVYDQESLGTQAFRTSFYKVVAPGGARSGLSANARVFNGPPAGNLHEGGARLSITRATPTVGRFTGGDPVINLDGPTDDTSASVTSTDLALPGSEYFIGVHRDRMSPGDPNLHVDAGFSVPESGTPDIVVDRVRFSPANGQTKVSVDVRNNGYATVDVSRSRLRFSNYPLPSEFDVAGIGPFGTLALPDVFWDPTNGTDTVTYTADITNRIAERSEANNSATATLNKVRPTINISLSDPLMDGDGDPNVWGRYVSGIMGATNNIIYTPADADGPGDIYKTFIRTATFNVDTAYSGAGPHTLANYDFGRLSPTTPQNLNRFSAYVKDVWGLTSDVRYISANVVGKSNFFTTFNFDRAARVYNIAWDKDVVRYDKSISQILGSSIPLVGDKRQKFIVHLGARGIATLNPNTPISLPLGADIELTAFDKSFIKETWTGAKPITDTFMVGTTLDVSSRTLDVTAAGASFQLRNQQLLNVRTPKIPLFGFGIPGLASVSANFSLGLNVGVSAGVKVGLDRSILENPLSPPARVGIMSPSFVAPRIAGSAFISGDVSVLGFDIASIEGRVTLGLNVTVGLDNNDPAAIIPFEELADRIAVKVTGDLSFGLSASIIIIGEIWSWEPDPITFNVIDTSQFGIITNDPGLPGPFFMRSLAEGKLPLELLQRAGQSMPAVKRGSDPVGAYKLSPGPQIVIDPATGSAMSVQVADGDPSAGETRGRLKFATRADGASAWSALEDIISPADVANPVLVRTNNAAAPYVLVYEAIELAGPTAAQTYRDRLAARDLRYRTWDGAAWSGEQVLAGDAGGDSTPAVAFSDNGTSGVAAWVHNTAAVPMDEDGQYARNQQEIHAAVWDDATQAWLPGEALTADAVADSQPAVFAEDGKLYVVWIAENGATNRLMFSTNDGAGWTAPAVLPTTGLAAGGQFTSVALGREAAGRVNVIFNYRAPNGDRSIDSKLFSRASTSANFALAAPAERISDNTNFSHVRTTNAPDGALVVSWQQSDGVTNEVFASRLPPMAGGTWSKPIQLTHGTTIEQHPAVAIEPDGEFQILFEVAQAGEGDAPRGANSPPVVDGVIASLNASLPEAGFTNVLDFDQESFAATGATATGRATIVNRGLAATDVFIDYQRGPLGAPMVLQTQTIRLSPGASFDAIFDFPIVAGEAVYSIRLRTPGSELVGDADNTTSYTLIGRPDLELVSLQLQSPGLPPGPGNPLVARVRNNSNVALGSFSIDFREGDELFPNNPWSSVNTVLVPMIGPGAEINVTSPITVPAVSGLYEFSAFVDVNQEIDEASEANNRRSMRVTRQADPAIGTPPPGQPAVNATLLNSSGVDNVRVNFTLFNFATGAAGSITSGPVVVRLFRSIDDEDFVQIDSQSFASVAPGGFGQLVTFITSGLAGDNRYRIVVDPQTIGDDSNPFNNVGEARLLIRGLPDLTPENVQLSATSVSQGAPVTLTVDVRNLGIAVARDVLVEVIGRTASNVGGTVFGSIRVDRINPLSVRTIEIPLLTAGLTPGTYDLVVVVNSTLETLELTDANNTSAAVQLTVTAAGGPFAVSSDYEFDRATPAYVLNFNEAVANLDPADVVLVNVTTGETIPSSQLDIDLAGGDTQAVITYLGHPRGVLPDGNYTLAIAAGAFTNTTGSANPSPIDATFFVFAGDANRDRNININDFSRLAANFNSAGTFSDGDFNYSGTVEIQDFALLASRFNTNLAAAEPAARHSARTGPSSPQPRSTFSLYRIIDDIEAPGT